MTEEHQILVGREFRRFKGNLYRLEGLTAYAEQQKDRSELERFKERLKKLPEQVA